MAVQDFFYNPTNEQRHEILSQALDRAGRAEDYEYILELLSPPPDILNFAAPMSLQNLNIGIIGGGLAGLSAAYELRKLGANITIFDAERTRIGGRVYTEYYSNSRKYFGEFGAMRIPVSHETTWHYINQFNLNTESLTSPESNNFIYAHNVRMRRTRTGENIEELLYPLYNLTEAERNTPWNELNSYAAETALNSLTPLQRSEILRILPIYSPEYAAYSNLSNRQVIEMLGLSQGFIDLLTAVDPFAGALLNISHDETMSGIYTFDFLNTYRIAFGMINLPLAFINSLANDHPPELKQFNHLGKINIKLGHIVNGIIQTSNNYVNIQYTNPNGSELSESFDLVICTIPYSTLRDIKLCPYFSEKKMQAIRELNYMDAQKTILLCNKRFWEEDEPFGHINGGISFTDLIIQSIVYPPDHIRCEGNECSPNEPGVLIASYNLGLDSIRLSNQNPFRRLEVIKRNVESVHGTPPGYLDNLIGKYKTVFWNSEQWFRGAFAAAYPGQKIDLAYNMLLPEYNNKVFFAGEHISTKPGWMQGSLQTGKWVANQVAIHVL